MYTGAMKFLDREFALLESFQQKIALEEREVESITLNSEKYAAEFKHLSASGDLGQDLNHFKNWLIEFHDHLDALAALRLTIQINLRNVRNYWEALQPEYDTLFPSVNDRTQHLIDQIGYDLTYLQLTMHGAERHLKLQEVYIERARLEQEKRLEQIEHDLLEQQAAHDRRQARQERKIEHLIAAIGAAIGVGQVAATELPLWPEMAKLFLLMIFSGLAAFFVVPWLISRFAKDN